MTTLRSCCAAPLWHYGSLGHCYQLSPAVSTQLLEDPVGQLCSGHQSFVSTLSPPAWSPVAESGPTLLIDLEQANMAPLAITLHFIWCKYSPVMRSPLCPLLPMLWSSTQRNNAHHYISVGLYLGLHWCWHLLVQAGREVTPLSDGQQPWQDMGSHHTQWSAFLKVT